MYVVTTTYICEWEDHATMRVPCSNAAVQRIETRTNRSDARMSRSTRTPLRRRRAHPSDGRRHHDGGTRPRRRRAHRERRRLGQRERARRQGDRRDVRRGVRSRARRAPHGRRGCSGGHDRPVPEPFQGARHVLPRMPAPQPDQHEHDCDHRAAEPCALAPHTPRRPEDHPRQGARLPVRRCRAGGQAGVRHPLRPPTAGRLPGRRPQRPFRRALAHAEGGPHRDPPEPFHLEVETGWGDWRFGGAPQKRHTEAPASPAAPRGQPRAS